jgi:hypothetical protein
MTTKSTIHIVRIGYNRYAFENAYDVANLLNVLAKADHVDYDWQVSSDTGVRTYVRTEDNATVETESVRGAIIIDKPVKEAEILPFPTDAS